jgi:hypothetical protein
VEKYALFAQNYAQKLSGYPEKKRPTAPEKRVYGRELRLAEQAKTCYQQTRKQNTP